MRVQWESVLPAFYILNQLEFWTKELNFRIMVETDNASENSTINTDYTTVKRRSINKPVASDEKKANSILNDVINSILK